MNKRRHRIPCEPARAGIVTNQPDLYDYNRPLCSVAVCDDPTCRARSIAYVEKATGETALYISDSSRKAAS